MPVLGVLPFRPELQIDQEDSLGLEETATEPTSDEDAVDDLDIAVARLPGLSNATDFWPLARLPGVRVRYVAAGRSLGRPDLVVIPGTKATVRDLDWLAATGLAERIKERAGDPDGPIVMGICGGFQMLGRSIDDPLGRRVGPKRVPGLGLLDVQTTFGPRRRGTGSRAGRSRTAGPCSVTRSTWARPSGAGESLPGSS